MSPRFTLLAIVLLVPLAARDATASGAETFVFDIPNPPSAPLHAGRAYDLVVLNVSGDGERGPGAAFDLVAEGASAPLASAGSVADDARPGRVKVTFPGFTFPEPGGYEIIGPNGFRLRFGVGPAPGAPSGGSGAPGAGGPGGAGAPRLVVDAATGRILEPGRPTEGMRFDVAFVNVPREPGARDAGTLFTLHAPGEDAPRDRRGAVADDARPGALTVAFPAVELKAGAWAARGPGFERALRVNPPNATEDPTDAPLMRHPVGFEPPAAPRGAVVDLTIVGIGITGERDVLAPFDLVAPSGRVAATAPAYVIDAEGGEMLAVTFPRATLDEEGRWTVRGPEAFGYSFPISGKGGVAGALGIPAPALSAGLASLALAAAMAAARERRRA